MREWVLALRSAGPELRRQGAVAPDASGWLLSREKTLGVVSWASRWCELRGTELLQFEDDGDIRSGLIDIMQFTLYTPKMPDAHKPFEFVFLNANTAAAAGGGGAGGATPLKATGVGSHKKKRRGSVEESQHVFHCLCAVDEGAYSAWGAALGKVAKVATAQQAKSLASTIGIGGGLLHTPGGGKKQKEGEEDDTRVSQEDFEVDSLLGEGAFGKVWLVRPKAHLELTDAALAAAAPMTPGADADPPAEASSLVPQKLLAMKVMAKTRVVAEQQVEHVQQERKLLQRLDHPFIVSLEYAFQSQTSLFLVMEFCQGGDLYEALHSKPVGERHFTEAAAQFVCAELVLALGCIHSFDMVYRDLKPENVLFDTAGHVRLTDFGLAKIRDPSILRETVCGTPLYMSPEAVLNHQYTLKHQQGQELDPPEVLPGLPNDWWMLGILTYELLLGTTPFRGDGIASLHASITTQELSFTPVLLDDDDNVLSEAIPPPKITAQAEGFVGRLLDKDPLARLCGQGEVQADLWWGSLDWDALAKQEIPPPPEEIAPTVSSDPLFHFPDRSDSFAADGDLAFHAPARSGAKTSDPFTAAKRGAVNDFYFDRNEARKKAAERDIAMEARFKQAAAAAAGAPAAAVAAAAVAPAVDVGDADSL